MLEVFEKFGAQTERLVDDVIVLDHIQREKGRLKVMSQKGEEVRLFLERGHILKRDEILRSRCNKLLRVGLAKETLVTARASDWLAFSRACYHLGNRHTRVQIGHCWLRFLEDPVLITLVERLGLETSVEAAEFEPESGAYGHGHAGKRPVNDNKEVSDHAHH